jgi:hypothetical protein
MSWVGVVGGWGIKFSNHTILETHKTQTPRKHKTQIRVI